MGHANLVLARLPLPVLERLDRRMERVDLLRGQILQRAEDPTRFAYFPTSGLVSLLALTAEGTTLELAAVGAEGLVGMPIVLPASSTPYQAVVQISGAAVRLRADLLTAELADSPALRDACLRYASQALREVGQSTVCHHFHPLSERLCRWLLAASDRVHSATLALTQESLAQVLGVPRTAVSAAAVDLQRADAIRCRRGSIELVNRRRLEVSACSCYTAGREDFMLTPPPGDTRVLPAVRPIP